VRFSTASLDKKLPTSLSISNITFSWDENKDKLNHKKLELALM